VVGPVVVGAVVAVVVGLGFAVVVGFGFGFAVVGGAVVGFAVVGAEVVGGAGVGPTVSASSITRTEGVVAAAVVATELTARGDATPVEVVDPDAETRSSPFPPRAAKNTTPRATTVTSTAAAMRCRSAGVTSRAPPFPGDPNGGRT
jgi:hypothetical protein